MCPTPPRQILLYEALGVKPPKYAHVPMILGPDKTKLSKRHGATSVVDYREMGYLPEAMINALARLGWSHGDQETFSVDELIELFGLDAIGKSAAVFDFDKLERHNQRYIQKVELERLLELLPPFLDRRGVDEYDADVLALALPHLTPRAKTLVELADWAMPYLVDEPEMDPKAKKKFLKPDNAPALEQVKAMVLEIGAQDIDALEEAFRVLVEEMGVKMGKVAQPVRVALTGRTFSPGIFEVMAILGQDKVLARLDRAIGLALA